MNSPYEIKKEICEIGRRIYEKGVVAANDGKSSVKVGPNEFYCTPTGVSKGYMTPDMIIRIDGEGKKIEGKLNPSSEIKMHLRVYRDRPDVYKRQVVGRLGEELVARGIVDGGGEGVVGGRKHGAGGGGNYTDAIGMGEARHDILERSLAAEHAPGGFLGDKEHVK